MADTPLRPDDFAEFFRTVHGYAPFPWQQRLTEQVLSEGQWPAVIDLPTGTGKTAVLDTAVFSLAARPVDFPRRIVFVIDRRIVVDQVCKRARCIASSLEDGRTPLLKRMRARLRALSGGSSPGNRALGVAALRGGIPRENEWSRQPDEPWVMVSTVDQFGSRLLFRGYGVTPGMRPINAGLAGNDCLVILDEVHLSVPFAETLRNGVRTFEPEDTRLPRRFSVVEMSATPSNAKADPFSLLPSDTENCEELRRRVHARKEAKLEHVQNHKAMPARIVRLVKSIIAQRTNSVGVDGGPRSIGVVVNRVRVARETFLALQNAGHDDVHLLTGRMRALDREDALKDVVPAVDPDGNHELTGVTIVVATQAIEVGADFSFDALITECAPIDSLLQRFGRLDRRGKYEQEQRSNGPAQSVIIGPKSVVAAKKPDPIYGHAVKATWEELQRRLGDDCDRIDIGSLGDARKHEELVAPKDEAPIVLQTHMDAWVQTDPDPVVQPLLEDFLHGKEHEVAPEVSIVWRKDTKPEVLRLVPPRQVEFMQVPIGAAKAWLSKADEVDVSDVPAQATQASVFNDRLAEPIYRWKGMGKPPVPLDRPDDIRPGDILVVPTKLGGISKGTWDPNTTDAVTDLGDRAQFAYGRRATLRLDADLLRDSPQPPTPHDELEFGQSSRERIREWLLAAQPKPEMPEELLTGFVSGDFDVARVNMDDDSNAYYVLSQKKSSGVPALDEGMIDESDESNSHQGTGVTLESHLKGVADRVVSFAENLGLPQELVDDLRLAGRLHDVGKVDRRFQEQLVGGDLVTLEMLDEPLAKSLPDARRVRRYPRGMRHEIASMAMIQSNLEVLTSAHDPDLVLHLVGTHHGRGRPLAPVLEDDDPRLLEYDFDGHRLGTNSNLVDADLALDMTDRFWRLVERYGYYGLAWLETILRLSDQRESAANS